MIESGSRVAVRSGIRDVWYHYEVDGVQFQSRTIAFGGLPLGALPVQGEVAVYYDPADPRSAVLLRCPTEMVWVALVFGLASPFLARWIWENYA